MFNAPQSKQGAARQFWAVIARYRRDFAGGGAFGFDMPTLAANAPAIHARLRALQAAYEVLPPRHARPV